MNKTLKTVLIIIPAIVALVAVAGIIKFNFINDDVIIQPQPVGENPGETTVESNKKTYTDSESGFKFDYPKEYSTSKDANGAVHITNNPALVVALEGCKLIASEESRINCLNQNVYSPNIIISYTKGDPEELWNKNTRFDFNNQLDFVTPYHTWKKYGNGGEFGGYMEYGLFLDDALIIAKYVYQDSDGGVQFNNLKSDKYLLNENEQRELLENILMSFIAGDLSVQNNTTTFNVFFNNTANDPNLINCEKVYPVSREVPFTLGVGLASLNSLIAGPTISEINSGFTTAIPNNSQINSLAINAGVAYVDVDGKFFEVGGSCGLMSAYNSLKETLTQFPTVQTLDITVNGTPFEEVGQGLI